MNELQKSNDAEKRLSEMYGEVKSSSPLRQVKILKPEKTMTYSFAKEAGVYPIEGNELKLTIIAINKKYVLAKFTNNVLDYRYASTEYPFADQSYKIKVMGNVNGKYGPVSDEMPVSAFKNYCVNRDDKLGKTKKPFHRFADMYTEGWGTAFKSFTIIYGVDAKDNLYRLELKSGINESLRKARKEFAIPSLPCYNVTTIKFEDVAKVGRGGDYYDVELVVGAEHTAENKVKYIEMASEFIVAIEARRKFFEEKRNEKPETDESDHPFPSNNQKTIEAPAKAEEFSDKSNIDGIL